MKCYRFRLRNSNKIQTLPFKNKHYFMEYISEKKIKIESCKIVEKRYRIPKEKLMTFTHNLISFLENEMDIISALEIILNQEKGIFSAILWNIRKEIINGSSIYLAFKNYEKAFPKIYLNLLQIGEETNRIKENLLKAYEEIKFELKLKRKIREAIFYPMIIAGFLIAVMGVIFVYVLPNFESFFAENEAALPGITMFLIFISQHFWQIFILILGALIFIVLSYRYSSTITKEKIRFKLPLINKIMRKKLIVEMSQNLYLLVDSNLDILKSLDLLKKNSKYLFVKKELSKVERNIVKGESIYESFRKMSIFSEEELKIIEIGERTQTLERAFEMISLVSQKQIEEKLFKMATLIQPILLLFMGIIITAILFAIYIPMFEMANSIL